MKEEIKAKVKNAHEQEAEAIEQQLNDISAKANSLASNVKNMGQEELRALKRKTANFMNDAREHGGEYLRQAGSQAYDAADSIGKNVCHTVRKKPFTSIAVAAGVGFVLALLARK